MLVLGGTGVIGTAVAHRLLTDGWTVDLVGRDSTRMPAELTAAGARFIPADRNDRAQLAAAYGDGADLLVDCLCFTAEHARQLLPFARDADSTVMISSKAVYVDDNGRHSNSAAPPEFPAPIREDDRTLAPGNGDYTTRDGYGANKVAAERILLDSGAPVTVLRPSKVHGVGGQRPREWHFVKRVLDRRKTVLLALPRPRHRPPNSRSQPRRPHLYRRSEPGSPNPEQRRPERTDRPRDRRDHRPPPRPPLDRTPARQRGRP